MSVYDQDKKTGPKRIFISYSSVDRIRTTGLALLLEAMGHQVFHDHRTIKPGMQWKAALQDGLDDATAVMVFWTKHASRSDWVRKEYEYFIAKYPDRVLVPVIGDETPMTELLKTRQHADFVPVVNDVLEKKRSMKKAGAGAREIEQAVAETLKKEGIEIKGKRQRRMFFLFLGFGWLANLLRYPWFLPEKAGSAAVEATAQASAGQVVGLAAAGLIGLGAAFPTAKAIAEKDIPEDVTELAEENEELRQANEKLEKANEELQIAQRGLAGMQGAIADLGKKIDGLKVTGPQPSCISPETFAGCQTGIQNARLDLTNRLDALSGSLALLARRPVAASTERQVTVGLEPDPQDANNCDTAPQPEYRPEPEYPALAIEGNIEGDVLVQATIGAEGNVTRVTAEGDSQILQDAAIEAVAQWRFTKCVIDGQPVTATKKLKINFSLHN